MPTATDAAALQLVLTDLSTEAIADLVALWRKYSDEPEFAALLHAAFPEIINPYAHAGALVTAQWYTEQAPELAYTATPLGDLPPERLTGSLGWALNAPGQATPLERIAGSAQRMIYDASRQTVVHNTAAEYGDLGTDTTVSFDSAPGTRWARYASATACSFCRMLATRHAVYRSAESAQGVVGRSIEITDTDRRQIAAGQATRDDALERRATYSNARAAKKAGKTVGATKTGRLRGTQDYGSKYHDHCRCIAVPVRPGTRYEPPDYVDQWEDDYIAATRAVSAAGEDTGGKVELNAILREMDAIDRDRSAGVAAPPIEMVDIEVYGRDGSPKTMRVPADSPAARAHAKHRSVQGAQQEAKPSGSGGPGGPGGPKGPGGNRPGGSGGGPRDPDPKKEVNHSLAGLSEAEIRKRTRGVTLPVIDPTAPPKGMAIYGDSTLDLSNAIEHSAYGLNTQSVGKAKKPKQTGHIWGIPAPNRTWFGKGETPQDIADILGQVLDSPDYYMPVVTGGNDRRQVIKEIAGVQYEAMWFPDDNGALVFSSVFPRGGRRTYRYTANPDALTAAPALTPKQLAALGFVPVQ
ncbi:MAG: hypothetical protein M3Y83_06935 [Actinomycetota bacterium]|nr:hypothetical protein [Actinomycetota bacterium]